MRIQSAPDCSSVVLVRLLPAEGNQSWNPQKNMLLNARSQHWRRMPISLSCMETSMMFHSCLKVSVWAQSELHPFLMTTDTAPWMLMELPQLAPAKDQPLCAFVVRKPMSEILLGFERRGQCVLETSQLCRISLVFIHICKNVFQTSCTVISNLYCSLLAVLTTYVANILLQLRKSVNNCRKQEFRTCMYFFSFYIKALQLKLQGKMLLQPLLYNQTNGWKEEGALSSWGLPCLLS